MSRSKLLGLGIDAGGTYTDVVLYDLEGGELLAKAKALTTHQDYSEGISAALDLLADRRLDRTQVVGLSTTLATNALVESRGGCAGLILLGYPDYTADRVRHRPTCRVAGAMSITGEQLAPLDESGLRRAARRLRDAERVEAIAISGFSSVMNPAHELRAAEVVGEELDLPLVLGHQLSQKLNAVHRATTAALNARLVPLIARLLGSVRRVLQRHRITAPVMIVKGDGSLMAESVGRRRPIETIVSGPAASVIGALYLARLEDGLVLDMGGTTLDVAVIRNGQPRKTATGAAVGSHLTHVDAIDIRTVGLGGDSYVQIDRNGEIGIGPRRVVPLSLLACQFPTILEPLGRLAGDGVWLSALHQPADVFVRLREGSGDHLSQHDRQLLAALEYGPITRVELSSRVGAVHPSLLQTDYLESGMWIARAGLTPTDCLHVLGDFVEWNAEAARFGATLYAKRVGLEPRQLCRAICKQVQNNLGVQCLSAALADDGIDPTELGSHSLTRALVDRCLDGPTESDGVAVSMSLRMPVVAIGAPVRAYVPPALAPLGSECIIPADADVANAVGAVVGKVVVELSATITRPNRGCYVCHADDGRYEFRSLQEAKKFARRHLGARVRRQATTAGAAKPHVQLYVRDRYGHGLSSTGTSARVFLETIVTARAVGRPYACEQRATSP